MGGGVNLQIGRDFIYSTVEAPVILNAMRDGKRIRYRFPGRIEGFRAYAKLRKAGAEYIDIHEEDKRHLWAGLPFENW